MLKGRRFTPAMVVAMIALAVALSGTAVAGTVKLITGSQIANGTIKLVDIHSSAKTALKGQSGPTGPQGPAGAQGPRRPAGRDRREGRRRCDRRSRSQGRQGRDRRSWPAGAAGVPRSPASHRRCSRATGASTGRRQCRTDARRRRVRRPTVRSSGAVRSYAATGCARRDQRVACDRALRRRRSRSASVPADLPRRGQCTVSSPTLRSAATVGPTEDATRTRRLRVDRSLTTTIAARWPAHRSAGAAADRRSTRRLDSASAALSVPTELIDRSARRSPALRKCATVVSTRVSTPTR